ncbi:GNAT family N-acetyltransferase [Deinococcus sp. YIM 77859]|uniref:GNAT family N-acetyltransferase n=1 Tax=Deinococcus sp. YIM 77859 TaxID=1540221 RepID=UPI00068CCD6B|nr:GNAT family N-acetyltransferase [Deinococcus sp. YIM 77859]
MGTSFVLRDLHQPGDFPGVAALLSASDPTWPVTPERLRAWDKAADPALFLTKVAEVEGRVVAVGWASRDEFACEERNLRVRPQWRGRGIGRALYRELPARVRARSGRERRTLLPGGPRHAPEGPTQPGRYSVTVGEERWREAAP